MADEPSVRWCGRDDAHPAHERRNHFGGKDYCTGMSEAAAARGRGVAGWGWGVSRRWRVYRWRPGYWIAVGPPCIYWCASRSHSTTHIAGCRCEETYTWRQAMDHADWEARRYSARKAM